MRGAPTGCRVDPAGTEERIAMTWMVSLVALYLALIFVSVFVMDWIVTPWGSAYAPPADSVDLWVVTTCDRVVGCFSKPLETTGYAAFRPFAVVTLWTTAASAALVLMRSGSWLLGKPVSRHVSALGYMFVIASFVSVLATVASMQSVPHSAGSATYGTPAPLVLIAAHVVGLLALTSATRTWCRVDAGHGGRIPLARVVR